MKTIKSNLIGLLNQNNRIEDWWESQPISIPFFGNKKMQITFMDLIPEKDANFIYDADTTLNFFFKKLDKDRMLISDFIYENCMEFLNAVSFDEADKPLWEITDKNEIWNFVYPKNVFVTRGLKPENNMFVLLVCDCEWEQEHGLQIVFQNGNKLTNVSAQDGNFTQCNISLNKNDLKHFPKKPEYLKKWWQIWK